MAEIRINATGGVKLYDADDSHYAQIVAGTITSNVDAITLGHDTVTIADNLSLGSDSAVLKFGADGDTTLTHTDGTGLTLNSTNKLCFNDASQFVQGSSATVLSIGATDEIDLTATAVDLNGTLDVSGTLTVAGTTTLAATSFGDANITNVGTIAADRILGDADSDSYMDFPGSDIVTINTGDNIRFRIDASGILSTGGETAPDTSKGGICLNQAQFDTNILTLKSSDVAHGMTAVAETDTYGEISKCVADYGGFRIRGLSDTSGYSALDLFGDMGGASNTDEAESTNGIIHIDGAIKNSTDRGAAGDDENIVCIKNGGNTEVIFKGDGEIFSNQTATVGTYDAYEDAQLIRAYDLSHMKGVINSKRCYDNPIKDCRWYVG